MNRPNETETHESGHPSRPGRPSLTAARLTELLDGAEPLDDERLCVCEHLEADHRTDGACSRCLLDRHRAPWRRCPEFRAADEEDRTAVLADEDLAGGAR
jgi:hypothetical protein